MKNSLAWVALYAFGLSLGATGCVVDPTYTYCAASSECEVAETCFEIRTSASSGAFCSQDCSGDLVCERNLGFDGSCMNVDGLGGICFQECDIRADCFSTSDCFDFTDASGFTNRVCLPTRL